MRRHALLAGLIVLAATEAHSAAEDKGREAVTTAKERLVDKAADPQRVDDCKVPPGKRDADHVRPSGCPHLDREEGTENDGAGG